MLVKTCLKRKCLQNSRLLFFWDHYNTHNTRKIGKVKEELQEFETEIAKADQEKMEQEFGDFLFSIINVARLYGINPENALEKTNRKFIRRFGYVEDKAKETRKNLSDMSLEEMEVYWQEAKGREQK